MLKHAKDQINKNGSLANDAIKYVYADASCMLMAFTYTGHFLSFLNTENVFDLLPLLSITIQVHPNPFMIQLSRVRNVILWSGFP